MSNPSIENAAQVQKRTKELLRKRRNYREEIKALAAPYRYIAFYGCGNIFNSMSESWNAHIGRKIDFCCDSNSQKWGEYFCGVKCISPQELMKVKDQCAVFVSIGEFKPVFKFLTDNGFPSVNLLYKFDLDNCDYLNRHDADEIASHLFNARESLSDGQSIRVFDAILNRVLGDGKDINVMSDVSEKNQYFPPDIIKLSNHEAFVDVGAFIGDTIEDFMERTQGQFDRIFSFEVDQINFCQLQDNVRQMAGADRIKAFNLGAWDSECEITYSVGKSESTVGRGEGKGRVVPLDNALREEQVTFIKMDIEGAEPNALRGVRNIIQAQKPQLAICVYHHISHLWEIPIYLKKLVPEYKIYLRHHTDLAYETVCYAML